MKKIVFSKIRLYLWSWVTIHDFIWRDFDCGGVQLFSSTEAAYCKVTVSSSSLNESGVLFCAGGMPSLRSSYWPGVSMDSLSASGNDVSHQLYQCWPTLKFV